MMLERKLLLALAVGIIVQAAATVKFEPPLYTLEQDILVDGEDVEKPFGPQTLPMHDSTIPLGPGFSGKQLVQYNGPLLSSVNVFPIFYGKNTAYMPRLMKFYKDITNSPHLDWLTEYNVPHQPGITRGFVSGSHWENSTTTVQTQLQDTDIQKYIHGLITSRKIIPTANSYFPIHFDPAVNILAGNQIQSCVSWCAYHSTMNVTGYNLPGNVSILSYGVIPDQGGGCRGGCGADSDTFNNLCSVSSHELVESITDPAVGLGLLTWYGPNGEIGDLCNHVHAKMNISGTVYTVQKEYSNAAGGCVASVPGSPVRNVVTPTTTSTARLGKTTAATTSRKRAFSSTVSKRSSTKRTTTTRRRSSSSTTTRKTSTTSK
ncbi:hypothetical protein BDR26DRAFT_861422 [Obelidium mucronatum]|nr:hypothetical protein BDR26DRAFT_861422 [Obelidium mucronatum]